MMGVDFVEASKCKGGEAPRLEQAQPISISLFGPIFSWNLFWNLFSALLIPQTRSNPKYLAKGLTLLLFTLLFPESFLSDKRNVATAIHVGESKLGSLTELRLWGQGSQKGTLSFSGKCDGRQLL